MQYAGFPAPNWYLREEHEGGKVVHWGPWMTRWAANQLGINLTTQRENAERRAACRPSAA